MIKVNEYFEGRVKSLGFESAGRTHTAGVVSPGAYRFSTEKEERLTMALGRLRFRLPDQDWQELAQGQSLTIPSGIEFEVEARDTAAYICAYY
jgi:uncharacterized protein YaiE (UPF0345 family)